jgi:hypothetical protein
VRGRPRASVSTALLDVIAVTGIHTALALTHQGLA